MEKIDFFGLKKYKIEVKNITFMCKSCFFISFYVFRSFKESFTKF